MSYILEALRQSQAEREQGRIPVLGADTAPAGVAMAVPRNRWGQVAALLAGAALLIALYAVVRPTLRTDSGALPTAVVRPVAESLSPAAQGPYSASLRSAPGVYDGAAEPGPAREDAEAVPPSPRQLPAPAVPDEAAGEEPPPALPPVPPLVEAPPPKGQPPHQVPLAGVERPPVREAQVPPVPVVAPPPGEALTPEDAAATALEEELARQAASDPELSQYPEMQTAALMPAPAGPTPIPPDLVASIDAFKREVAGGQGREKRRDKPQDKDKDRFNAIRGAAAVPTSPPSPVPTPAPVAVAPTTPSPDPTRLRLTREQEAALPQFRLTVHVFDPDPSRRFVLINGQKYGEGSKTREGLTVETIRVDGAVLVHDGHQFFVHR
jgi:general secretion pathway protein B